MSVCASIKERGCPIYSTYYLCLCLYNSLTVGRWPPLAAKCRAVAPQESVNSRGSPSCTNSLTRRVLPEPAAYNNIGVCVARSKRSAALEMTIAASYLKGCSSVRKQIVQSAPALISSSTIGAWPL